MTTAQSLRTVYDAMLSTEAVAGYSEASFLETNLLLGQPSSVPMKPWISDPWSFPASDIRRSIYLSPATSLSTLTRHTPCLIPRLPMNNTTRTPLLLRADYYSLADTSVMSHPATVPPLVETTSCAGTTLPCTTCATRASGAQSMDVTEARWKEGEDSRARTRWLIT